MLAFVNVEIHVFIYNPLKNFVLFWLNLIDLAIFTDKFRVVSK